MLIYQRVIDDWNQIHLIEILLANLLAFQNLKTRQLGALPLGILHLWCLGSEVPAKGWSFSLEWSVFVATLKHMICINWWHPPCLIKVIPKMCQRMSKALILVRAAAFRSLHSSAGLSTALVSENTSHLLTGIHKTFVDQYYVYTPG